MVKKLFLIAVFILLAFFAIVRMNEDTWICEGGEWVKHGNPSPSAPEGRCGWRENFDFHQANYKDK